MIENRNIFQALEDYFTGQLDRRFDKDNRFGDVASRYGNELLDMSKAVAGNAGNLSFSGFREAAPDMLDPYIRAAGYFPDMAFAGLLSALGGAEKAIAAGAEILSTGNTSDEDRLARDLLGMAEAAGINPEGRMLGVLAPYMQQYLKGRIPDYQYAGRSLLQRDLEGVKEAFTETDMLPRAVGADITGGVGDGFYLQDGTYVPNRQAVELYSPSVRAAEKLPQNKGSYEQLRSWMLKKGGANLDELQMTGADKQFAGKEVTKQELIDYLNKETPVIDENIYESFGKLGSEAPSSDEMLNEYLEMALPDEVNYYREEVIPELVFEQDDLLNADNLLEAYKDYEASAFDPDIDLSNLLGTIAEQEGNYKGMNVPVKGKHLKKLMNDLGYENIEEVANDYYKVDGLSLFTFDKNQNSYRKFNDYDEAAEYYGFDAEEMAKDNLTEMAEMDGLYSDPAHFYQVMLGKGDADDYYNLEFSEGDTQYSEHFLGGAEEYKEKVYHLRDDFMPLVDMKNAKHFDEEQDRIVSHARSGMYEGISGDNVYLMGEAQSDVGQYVRDTRKELIDRLERDRQLFVDNTPNVTAADYDEAEIRQQFPTFRTFDQMQAYSNYNEAYAEAKKDFGDNLGKLINDFSAKVDNLKGFKNPTYTESDEDVITAIANYKTPEDVLKLQTQINDELIEDRFRELYAVRKVGRDFHNVPQPKPLDRYGQLSKNIDDWPANARRLFELYKAYAYDQTFSNNKNALFGKLPKSAEGATYLKDYLKNNPNFKVDLMATVGNKRSINSQVSADDLGVEPEFGKTAEQQALEINVARRQLFVDDFQNYFLGGHRYTPFDPVTFTTSHFNDLFRRELPSLKEETKQYKEIVDKEKFAILDAQRSDDYQLAFSSQDPDNMRNIPPLTGSTNKWLDMTIKRNLHDAITSGGDWFALPNADAVKRTTGGKLEGHKAFYENIAPLRLKKIIEKIDSDAKIETIKMKTLQDGEEVMEEVKAVRLNEKFIKNAIKTGIPQLGVVGGVGLMDFMVRDNKDGRNDSLLSY